ncbi:hypothetical protein O0547_23485 [Brevibacillus laterosporus]|uniref:Uncharacterized protein n=2 Tax=Brevibacillus laterosporus TaxID=1465 RepID=A0AAP8Q989_BRELA|nr:hypothetical protein [Brevibacillus laterosporus]MCZ0828584.1 hypothetical protein [Brevibacillus laterosporus]MCZ0852558.1 hypothetical protein [Brevibacillus laterosporus]PPA90217.1 hypothetical protein C4A77_24905 [Brevibacillus laterosporus]RFB33316.1 hypothetical protein DZB91_13840 [Brevibacillus sp. VP]
MPQLGFYLEQCNEHIEFTVKVSTMSFGSLFGGGLSSKDQSQGQIETRPDGTGTYMDGYKVADETDMEWLANVLG